MSNTVVILHGYSDEKESFEPLAEFLSTHASHLTIKPIYLGNYISLDDTVTIQDLAKAFANALASEKISTAKSSFDLIVHSTGALVSREWLASYFLELGKPCPVRRYLMLAPANFGSHLAHTGKTMFGRIVKGWKSNFEVGTKVLNALELASEYSWNLARRDLFGEQSFFKPSVCKTAILVGSKPYQSGFRKLVDKKGSDGTVFVSTANLNAVGYDVLFKTKGKQTTPKPWKKSASDIAFGVFSTRDHATIIRPDKDKNDSLGQFILEFLSITNSQAYTSFAKKCENLTAKTLPDNPKKDIFHRYQHVVTHLKDDLGFSIDDYFLEFYKEVEDVWEEDEFDDLTLKFHRDILEYTHVNKLDESYRSFLFDLTDMKKKFTDKDKLTFSLSAADPGPEIYYTAGASQNISEIPVPVNDVRFWHPNKTMFLNLIVERGQTDNVFRLEKFK